MELPHQTVRVSIGSTLPERGSVKSAFELFVLGELEQSAALLDELKREHPHEKRLQFGRDELSQHLGMAYHALGLGRMAAKQHNEALALFDKAHALLSPLSTLKPSPPDFKLVTYQQHLLNWGRAF